MKAIVVLHIELSSPDDITDVLKAIDPPNVPCFAGDVQIAVGDIAQQVIDWLNED